jgi:hypothetical protein
MSNQSLKDKLNGISDLFVLGSPPIEEEEFTASRIYNIADPITLTGENPRKFDSAIDDLLKSFKEVSGTVSPETVIEALIPLIREKKTSQSKFTTNESDLFKKSICDLPLRQFRAVRPILGVNMSRDAAPVRIGDFLIDFGRGILPPATEASNIGLILKPEVYDQLLIQATVKARDTTTATDLADALFYRFELIFRVLIGRRTESIEVGVVNYKGPQMHDRFLLSENGRYVRRGSSWDGAIQPFILNDPHFPMPTGPFIRLFELISRDTNEFEKHVIRCAEWTGQAIAEPNAASALVKAAIALEVLFSANEKGIITPSIMAQIAESCAFLLGNDEASSVKIERLVKDLYGVRSAVVHSGKDSVDEKDLNAFISIYRSLVILLLSKKEFAKITRMSQLADYFKSRKYSSAPTPE